MERKTAIHLRPMSLLAAKKQGVTLGVARPSKEGGCWAQVYVYAGDAWSPLAACGNPALPRRLTCVKHQDREAAARELDAKDDPEL